MTKTILIYDDVNLKVDLASFRTVREAMEVVGGLSTPSKMPGFGTSISAGRCITGGIMKKKKGTICYSCYAANTIAWQQQAGRMVHRDGKLHGSRYPSETVQNALERRYQALSHSLWVPAMVRVLSQKSTLHPYFRWFDSGDLQSAEHLGNIFTVCRYTPAMSHWLPTREKKFVETAIREYGPAPDNLTIRASANKVGAAPPKFPNSSMVILAESPTPEGVARCPASEQKNYCGECRACWDRSVPVVAYLKH